MFFSSEGRAWFYCPWIHNKSHFPALQKLQYWHSYDICLEVQKCLWRINQEKFAYVPVFTHCRTADINTASSHWSEVFITEVEFSVFLKSCLVVVMYLCKSYNRFHTAFPEHYPCLPLLDKTGSSAANCHHWLSQKLTCRHSVFILSQVNVKLSLHIKLGYENVFYIKTAHFTLR